MKQTFASVSTNSNVFSVMYGFSIILFAGYFFIPKSIEFQKMKASYNKLATERVKVMELFHDLQRLQQMDELLRKNLGSEVDLHSFKDGLDSISEASQINNNDIQYSTNQISNIPTKAPIDGYITQRMIVRPHIWKSNHYGIDIAAKKGTRIKSSATGVVTMAEPDLYYTGGTLIFDHGHGISTLYMHMQKLFVKKGQKVKQGDIIGTVGSTGRATGAHLDIRLNWFQIRLDPATVLDIKN